MPVYLLLLGRSRLHVQSFQLRISHCNVGCIMHRHNYRMHPYLMVKRTM